MNLILMKSLVRQILLKEVLLFFGLIRCHSPHHVESVIRGTGYEIPDDHQYHDGHQYDDLALPKVVVGCMKCICCYFNRKRLQEGAYGSIGGPRLPPRMYSSSSVKAALLLVYYIPRGVRIMNVFRDEPLVGRGVDGSSRTVSVKSSLYPEPRPVEHQEMYASPSFNLSSSFYFM
jgi:hypothetical protein